MRMVDGNYRHVALPNLDELDLRSPDQPVKEWEEVFSVGGIESEFDLPLTSDEKARKIVNIDEARRSVARRRGH